MLPAAWDKLDRFYTEYKNYLGAAIGASDTHFGKHDFGRILTAFPGKGANDLKKAIIDQKTSPLFGISPSSPSLSLRLKQQQRSMIWLARERRLRRVGNGVGPIRKKSSVSQ